MIYHLLSLDSFPYTVPHGVLSKVPKYKYRRSSLVIYYAVGMSIPVSQFPSSKALPLGKSENDGKIYSGDIWSNAT